VNVATVSAKRPSKKPKVDSGCHSSRRGESPSPNARGRRPGPGDCLGLRRHQDRAPDPTLVAILQLDTLAKFAESDNTKLIIPAESAALLVQSRRSERDGRRAHCDADGLGD